MSEEHRKLVRKIAEWRFGEDGIFVSEDGEFIYRRTRYVEEDDEYDLELLEDFTVDISACFKWLMTHVYAYVVQSFWAGRSLHQASIAPHYDSLWDMRVYSAEVPRDESPALAVCLAFEKMIDAGEECCDSQASSLQAAS